MHRFHICTKFEIRANLNRFCTIPKSVMASKAVICICLNIHLLCELIFENIVKSAARLQLCFDIET